MFRVGCIENQSVQRGGIGVPFWEWYRGVWFSIHEPPKHRNTNPITESYFVCDPLAILYGIYLFTGVSEGNFKLEALKDCKSAVTK